MIREPDAGGPVLVSLVAGCLILVLLGCVVGALAAAWWRG